MADIKYPDFAGESGCTRSGDVISLTGTAISSHVTFASAEADSAIDFDNGDTLYVDVIDGSGNAATWSATYDTTGDGTLTRTATVAGTAVGSLGTTGIQVTSSVPGPWFRTGERISYVTESVTTGNVTVGVNRVHSLTIAGLTANRNFTVPSGSPGDWIGIHIDDGDDTYAIIIIGDTGVDVGNAGAATEKTRLFIQNETYFLRCRAANDWFVEQDGRIASHAAGYASGAYTHTTNGAYEELTGVLDTEKFDIGGIFDHVTNKYFTVRRSGKYRVSVSASCPSISDRAVSRIRLNINQTGDANAIGFDGSSSSAAAVAFCPASISGSVTLSAGDDIAVDGYQNDGTSEAFNVWHFSVEEVF